MTGLTYEQCQRCCAMLGQLRDLSSKCDLARLEEAAANARWNAARAEYADIHSQIVREFGPDLAPTWIEAIYGPRESHAQ